MIDVTSFCLIVSIRVQACLMNNLIPLIQNIEASPKFLRSMRNNFSVGYARYSTDRNVNELEPWFESFELYADSVDAKKSSSTGFASILRSFHVTFL